MVTKHEKHKRMSLNLSFVPLFNNSVTIIVELFTDITGTKKQIQTNESVLE